MSMKIETVWSTAADTGSSVRGAYGELRDRLGQAPDWLVVYASVKHSSTVLLETLSDLAPGVPLQGGTTCLGVMTAEGFHSANGVGLGLFGVSDPEGDYGVGAAEIGSDPRKAGADAIQQAIERAGRTGEPRDMVWLSGAPGSEERVLRGIQDVIGPDVPIAGGSTADNTVEGNWLQFANGAVYRDAVVVSALYCSVPIHLAFHSGYSPTRQVGTVTRARGRTVYEIDGRPAAEVYNEWTGGVIGDFLEGGNVLAVTTLNPLGRVVGQVGSMPYYRLAHPDAVVSGGALSLFSDADAGDQFVHMTGTHESLVARAGNVAQSALDIGRIGAKQVCGALVVYCAGCMLTVQDRMDQVSTQVSDALGGKPFLGTFTFGEQGSFIGGENRHGNLMISVVVFESGA
jgi:hypothetical protein